MDHKMNHSTTWLRGYTRNLAAIETIWKKVGREAFIFAMFSHDDFPGDKLNSTIRNMSLDGHIVKRGYLQPSDTRGVWSLSSNAIQHCITRVGPVNEEIEACARARMDQELELRIKLRRSNAKAKREQKRVEKQNLMKSMYITPIFDEFGGGPWTFSDVSHIVGTPARLWVMHKFDLITNTGEKRYITRKNHGKVWKLSDSAIEAICQQ
jgi:hypothetical protein